jgi:hypothetical protein
MIVPDDWQTQAEPLHYAASDLPNHAWFTQLPAIQQARLVVMANGAEIYGVTEALDRARNTVVAAVDGSAGNPEGDFLAAAYRRGGNLSVYDPVLQVNMVNALLVARQVPPGAVTLTSGSVTGYGQRVPQTALLIPHPGPKWATDPGPAGLAACIESVLGAQSNAWVLTDNEMQGHSQSQALIANLQAINAAHAQTPGYTALTWTAVPPVVKQAVVPGEVLRFTELGRVRLQIRHEPPHKLITVHRP